MANEQSGMPLRRWRPFFGAFVAIDDSIEAAGHPRAAFLDMRVQILKLLRAATDDGVGEQLCAALDDAMAESLKTLLVTPVLHGALASTDLARAVGALAKSHESPRIRRLAGDVVRGWTTANVATTTVVNEELQKLSAAHRIPRQEFSAVFASDGNARAHKEKLSMPPPAKMLPTAAVFQPQTRKVPPAPAKTPPTPNTSQTKKLVVTVDESKMEATKRKWLEGYQEAERMKRQRTTKKIDDKVALKMFEQKQRMMHPVLGGRGRAACRTTLGVMRSLLPSLQMT